MWPRRTLTELTRSCQLGRVAAIARGRGAAIAPGARTAPQAPAGNHSKSRASLQTWHLWGSLVPVSPDLSPPFPSSIGVFPSTAATRSRRGTRPARPRCPPHGYRAAGTPRPARAQSSPCTFAGAHWHGAAQSCSGLCTQLPPGLGLLRSRLLGFRTSDLLPKTK